MNTYIEAGSATSLVCAVAGSPGTATYAWYKVVDDGSTAVDGATDATYTISTPATADNGVYYCQVIMTVSGVANGPFPSETATLYVRCELLKYSNSLKKISKICILIRCTLPPGHITDHSLFSSCVCRYDGGHHG